MTLWQRLRAYKLTDEAREVAREHGCTVRDLERPGPAREALELRIRARGWNPAAVMAVPRANEADRRNLRHRTRLPRSVSLARLSKERREHIRRANPDAGPRRLPVLRSECEQVERPCPYVSCRHHLYLDVSTKGLVIKINFPDAALGELLDTCALDVADRGEVTQEDVARRMNITRAAVQELEERALAKLREAFE